MGASHARALVAEGANVVIGDILDDEGAALADELGSPARFVHLDVTQPDQWGAATSVAQREFGALNVLVNNAGIVNGNLLSDFELSAWQQIIDINLTGTFLLVRMLGNITSSWGLCARLSQLQDQALAEDRHSSLAKAFCTTRMRETVGWARELMGGNGILLEHNVGRFAADAEAIYSYEGTREMNTLIVGRSLTGLSAFV